MGRQLNADLEKLKSAEKKLQQEEKRISNLADQLFRKEDLFIKQITNFSQREKKLQEEIEKIKKIEERVIDELGRIVPMSREEAKKNLFSLLREEVKQNLEFYKEQEFRRLEERVEEKAIKIICLALEKYSSELIFTRTVNTLKVESQQMISRIIGREGRNINAFRRITGTEVIIDKDSDDLTIQISSFNSLRREIAFRTLQSLIKEDRVSPIQIEKTYHKVSSEINTFIIKNGEEVLKGLKITNVHPKLVEHLGKLRYRTSYGQNVLEHSLEVAKLAGSIAAELGLDVLLARRAGLFHDIGKSAEDNEEYSHVLGGIDLAKKYKEPEVVINAIASHHRDFPANNLYSLIVLVADKLSAARPGARGHQLEAYIERMNSLEDIASEFFGIKKSYAFQAGREIWIIVDAEKLNDHKTWEVSQKIREKIREKIIIPGEITIYVVREKKFVYKLHDKKEKQSLEGKIFPSKSKSLREDLTSAAFFPKKANLKKIK